MEAWIGHQKNNVIMNICDVIVNICDLSPLFAETSHSQNIMINIENIRDKSLQYLQCFTNNCDVLRIIMTDREYS